MEWYKILRKMRREKEMSQDDLALMLGCQHRRYWGWEKGINIPGPIYQKKIADALGVAEDAIFSGELRRRKDERS